METKFNFKSQVCTSIEQSRRLLELGLKKETADICYSFDSVITQPFIPSDIFRCVVDTDTENKNTIPAWSLHRLVSLTNTDDIKIACNEKHCWGGNVLKIAQRKAFEKDNLYDNLIDCIEWLIKEGYFNKEYLA